LPALPLAVGAALQPALDAPEDSVLKTLAQAREERIDAQIDALIADKLKGVKLRGILKKYAKSAHPFRDCVKDNMSRFGPGRTEAVCATLKDTIKGNKNWRNGGSNTSESDAVIDADVLLALDVISEIDLGKILLEARALEEYQTTEAVPLFETNGRAELERWGVGHEELVKLEESA
jgi:hypothetical protein